MAGSPGNKKGEFMLFKLIEFGTYWEEYFVSAQTKEEAKKRYLKGYADSGDTEQEVTSLEIEEVGERVNWS